MINEKTFLFLYSFDKIIQKRRMLQIAVKKLQLTDFALAFVVKKLKEEGFWIWVGVKCMKISSLNAKKVRILLFIIYSTFKKLSDDTFKLMQIIVNSFLSQLNQAKTSMKPRLRTKKIRSLIHVQIFSTQKIQMPKEICAKLFQT